MKIGFVGLGIMGKPMAKNLLKHSYKLYVYNRSGNSAQELSEYGAVPAKNSSDLAKDCDIIITMVQDSPQVKNVLFGENGVYESIKSGSVVIDMSSINPEETRKIGEKLALKGVEMLDAPVSGGEPKAIDGTLSVMVGGKEEIFTKCYDVLKAMASSVVRVGELGAGNVAKLANQIIVAANIAALSEALNFAKRENVNPETVVNAIKGGLAGSNVMEAKAMMMLNNNFKPGFRTELHIKDLNNAINAAHSSSIPVPVTAQVMEMMQSLKAMGKQHEDHSALYEYYENLSK